jgi:hypothetical protein
MSAAVAKREDMTLDEALKASMLANSFTRMEVVADWLNLLPRADCFRLLGSEWTTSDRIWRSRGNLRGLLRSASREQLDLMMEPEELAALARMPERFTVYRGCYAINRPGLSWSTDRAVAEEFPRRARYIRPERPLLRIGTVRRDRAVLKLDRNEQEIIADHVSGIREELLAPHS